MSRRPAGLIPIICIAWLTSSADLSAHQGLHRRSLRLLLRGDCLVLSALLVFPEGGESRRLRLGWDRSGDGRLDSDEREAALAELERRDLAGLRVVLDGAGLTGRRTRADAVGLLGPVAASESISVSLQLVFDFPPAAGPRLLELTDRPPPGQHVPVGLQPARGVELGEHNGLEQGAAGLRQVVGVLDGRRTLRVRFRATSERPAGGQE